MSAGAFGAIAHSSEAPAKLATPIAKTRDSPKMSPSDPPTRMSDPSVTRYALTPHCWVASPPPSSCWIEGSATLTTEPSMKAIDEPRMLATSVPRATRESSAGGATPTALSIRAILRGRGNRGGRPHRAARRSEGLRGSRGRLDAELHRDVLGRSAALDRDRRRGAALRRGDGCREAVPGVDRLAAEV